MLNGDADAVADANASASEYFSIFSIKHAPHTLYEPAR